MKKEDEEGVKVKLVFKSENSGHETTLLLCPQKKVCLPPVATRPWKGPSEEYKGIMYRMWFWWGNQTRDR